MSAPRHEPACAPKLGILDHFAGLDDPRQSVKVLFPLPEVMLLVLCATIAGCDDLVEARNWVWSTSISCAPICRSATTSRATIHSTTS